MRGRGWWLGLAAAVPVGLPLLGRWPAALAFAGITAAAVGPVLLAQWWARRRQRAAHAAGALRWFGRVPLERAALIWELGPGLALLFGGGVPVCITTGDDGLTLRPRGLSPRRHPSVTVLWTDIAGARAEPAGRLTAHGRVAALPLTAVILDLPGDTGGPLTVTTHAAGGLVETVAARHIAQSDDH
ncbi:hypothetical protein ACQP2P_35295 [Dactylosporangium sp. CA-139114]|uniref:hypothetical protein n=1 Tax=Dactylosporangium sp. CA-139114 TaxID=3239931 RepID=UPI003D993912